MTVSRAVEEGELGDNYYLPIIYASLHESINLVRRTIRTVKEKIFEISALNSDGLDELLIEIADRLDEIEELLKYN